jgi:hypothetical protein
MSISGVSSGNFSANMGSTLATRASQNKALNVQDEITIAVINQVHDQQKAMADGLIKMMKESTIDIYA